MTRQYNHRLKLDRALHHAIHLKWEIERWLRGNPYSTVGEFDAERGEHVVRVEIFAEPPALLGLMVGDCLHNLRSALDNLVYELAVAHKGQPLSKSIEGDIGFPIFKGDDQESAKRLKCMVRGTHPGAQTILEQLQPHYRGNNYASDPLWVLSQLSNVDKHRFPPLTPFAYLATSIEATAAALRVDYDSIWVREPGPVEDGAELIRFRTRPPNTGDEMDVKLDFRFDVAFAQGSPADGEPVYPGLLKMRSYIDQRVLPPFAPFLP